MKLLFIYLFTYLLSCRELDEKNDASLILVRKYEAMKQAVDLRSDFLQLSPQC